MIHHHLTQTTTDRWACPLCGHAVAVETTPALRIIVLVTGDPRAVHVGAVGAPIGAVLTAEGQAPWIAALRAIEGEGLEP